MEPVPLNLVSSSTDFTGASSFCTPRMSWRLSVMNHGTILLEGTPAEAVASVQGRIWRKAVEKSELADYRMRLPVISHHVSEGRMVMHVMADDRPEEGFEAVDATLEDVYFSTITQK